MRPLDSFALVLGLAASLAAASARADDAACIAAMNQNASNVAKVLGREVRACVKAADKSGSATAESCATGDVRGKVAKAEQKTQDGDVGGKHDRCDGTAPTFLYEGTSRANGAATLAALNLTRDLLGADLDASVVQDGDKSKARCRDTAVRSIYAVLDSARRLERVQKRR
jgi:hypothetical protein